LINRQSASYLAAQPWMALAWLVLLGMLSIGLLNLSGDATPGLQTPELELPVFLALCLPALCLLVLQRAPQLAGQAGLAALTLSVLLLLKWSLGIRLSDLLLNHVVDGVAVLGRYALGTWLAGIGLACWGLARASVVSLTMALLAGAALSMAVCAACVFALSCWVLFGELPGSTVLVSVPTLAIAVLLTLAVLLTTWHRVARHSEAQLDEDYRWIFARQLALLLSTSVLAGLAAAVLVSVHAAELLSDGLSSRAARQAQVLERHVERSAAILRALYDQGLRGPALAVQLERVADRVRLGSDTRFAMPVLRTPELDASLLADGSVRVALTLPGAPAPFWAQLRLRNTPGLLGTQDRMQHGSQPWVCTPELADRLRCSAMLLADAEPSAVRPVGADLIAIEAPGLQAGIAGLLRVKGPFAAHTQASPAPIGELGTQLLITVDASSLLRALGAPLLQAMFVLSGLALLGTAWSYWRQLPKIRDLYLKQAQAEATMLHLPLAILVLDELERVLEANPAAVDLLGAAVPALLGQSITTILPEWRGSPQAGLKQPLRQIALDQQGASLPVEVSITSFTLRQRRRSLLMLRDLRAEQRDAQDRERWRRVFEDAGWGIVIGSTGPEPVVQQANRAYAQMLGYSPNELHGTPVRECIVPSFLETLMALRSAAEHGGTVQAQLRHRHRDGRELPTLVSLSATRDEQGELMHFVVSVQDISALKDAEEQATQHAHHLRAVLDALPVGVWIGDDQGQVQQTNRAARKLWGAQCEGVAGTAWWQRAPCSARIDHDSLMRRAAILCTSIDSGMREVELPDGARRAVLTTASPILDGEGRVVGAIAIDEDLSSVRRGELAASQAHEQLERILEACAVGIALSDAQGRVQRRNLAWNLLIGGDGDADVLDRTLEPGDSLRQRDLIARIACGELPTYVGEHRMRRAAGTFGWIMLVVSRLAGASDEASRVLLQVIDIDDRRQIADEIAGSRLRLAAAQKLARMGDWQWDIASDRISCSDQMLSMLGHVVQAKGDLSSELILQMVHPDEREQFVAALDPVLLGAGQLARDVRMIRSDGEELIVYIYGVAQRTSSGLTLTGTMQDVTDRKRIESELRESRERLRELVAYEGELIEDERKRIAREVHDELGQLLTALRLDLSMLSSQLQPAGAGLQRAQQMRETMATMTDVVRHIASNLRPAALDLGLTAAIEWLAEDFSLRWETRCELQLPEQEPELSESAALALFRAVQESLTNVAKHASAAAVSITMRHDAGQLSLCVSDDGHGFDPLEVASRRRGGLGLLGMRERMHAIGAQLSIQSGPSGTLVEISYPTGRSNKP